MTGIEQRAPRSFFRRAGRTKLARLLEYYQWREAARPEDAALLLLGSERHLATVPVRVDQLVDCVEGTRQLTHKGNLARLLRRAPATATLQPETFMVDGDPGEFEHFVARARANPDAVWIAKPVARGRGIGVRVVDNVAEYCAQRDAPRPHGPELVQRYIDRPLLLEETKSEIRSYVLIACTDPLLVLYHDGTVRLTSLPFQHGDWSNPLRHVTNTYRQKHASAELWEQRGSQLKWTLGALGRDVLARGLTDDPAWVDTTLRPALIGMLHLTFAAAAPQIVPRPGAFQLLGMDTLLEDDLQRVWLTEIQLGPGLSIDNPVKSTLIPSMLREAMSIVLEVRDRIAEGQDPTQLASRRQFRWVYTGDAVPEAVPLAVST